MRFLVIAVQPSREPDRRRHNCSIAMRFLAPASLAVFFISTAYAQPPASFSTLYTFGKKDNSPSAGVVGYGGALYGTTLNAVFTLGPAFGGGAWTETGIQEVELSTGVAFGPRGEMYGMTLEGGESRACPLGCGTVFALTPPGTPGRAWTRHVLYSFKGNGDGALPTGAPLIGSDGTIYGTTQFGGVAAGCSGTEPGCGTVFALTPPSSPGEPWSESVIYVFLGDNDGANPGGGLVIDENGDLYGTTPVGGKYHKGAAFQLSPPAGSGGNWIKNVIYDFTGRGRDGYQPSSGLVDAGNGVLYGTTALGGIADGGTVFALYQPTPGLWSEKVLYRFEVQEGLLPVPNGNLTISPRGALFGTTASGGISTPACHYGCGQVYALYPSNSGGTWTEQVLYRFTGALDGASPLGGLVMGANGALYGTTRYGGDTSCKPPLGCGTAFRVLP